jgi:hypothetical protein
MKVMGNSKKLKIYTLEEAKNKHLGNIGTERRNKYEYELRLDLLDEVSKLKRKERHGFAKN